MTGCGAGTGAGGRGGTRVVVSAWSGSAPARGCGRGGAVALELAVLVEVPAHGVDVVVEAEGAEGPADVVAVDGLALLLVALVGCLAGDEADELGDALLHRLLGLLGDLGVGRQDLLHDAADVGDGQQPVLLLDLQVTPSSGAAAHQTRPPPVPVRRLPVEVVGHAAAVRRRRRRLPSPFSSPRPPSLASSSDPLVCVSCWLYDCVSRRSACAVVSLTIHGSGRVGSGSLSMWRLSSLVLLGSGLAVAALACRTRADGVCSVAFACAHMAHTREEAAHWHVTAQCTVRSLWRLAYRIVCAVCTAWWFVLVLGASKKMPWADPYGGRRR